ncbi:metallophosphoesterase family protein [Elioraea sp.]|uniref:metallophosphoesterase family protein n=1 Tax=Elioraea sp. TaxID=2185103 RepID=UPI003F7029CF
MTTAWSAAPDAPIPAVLARGRGHRFVLYGDACSGVPGAPHEQTFARVNATLRRLRPAPEFILFPGDEIIGLSGDPDTLRRQWRHFLDHEMAWLDRAATPIFHSTGNHTAHDRMSEAVFREVLAMPRNGPPGQEGLAYVVRRGDLVMVVVHTLWSGLGGEGHVETDWLRRTLAAHDDARHKLVIGHHPVFPVNGFAGAYQRQIGPEHAEPFWTILVEAGVLAYLCSHILAFDVQVHRGVLQITSAGAGTAHRMPEGVEYLHLVQAALDDQGLRYQVIDSDGQVRETLTWPVALPAADRWTRLAPGDQPALAAGPASAERTLALRFSGIAAPERTAAPQTLFAAREPSALPALWIGLRGATQRLTVFMRPEPGRSPHLWLGPTVVPGQHFDIEMLVHAGMGPGGVLWRDAARGVWSSLAGASAWGAERLPWPPRWIVGHGGDPQDEPFAGTMRTVSAVMV